MTEQGQCVATAFGYPWCVGKCQDHQDCTAKPRNAADEIERLRASLLRDERAMERLDKELTDRTEETMRARAQRDQLLAALKQIEAGGLGMLGMREVARAAVAAVEDD